VIGPNGEGESLPGPIESIRRSKSIVEDFLKGETLEGDQDDAFQTPVEAEVSNLNYFLSRLRDDGKLDVIFKDLPEAELQAFFVEEIDQEILQYKGYIEEGREEYGDELSRAKPPFFKTSILDTWREYIRLLEERRQALITKDTQ